MSREFSQANGTFWTGETGRRLRGNREAQVLAHYAFDNLHANSIGLYYVAKVTMAHEVGFTLEEIDQALGVLSLDGFAFYDDASETMFVSTMAGRQLGLELKPGDKRIPHVRREISKYSASPFFRKWLSKYGASYHLNDLITGSPFEGASGDSGRGIPLEKEKESEKESERENPISPFGESSSSSESAIADSVSCNLRSTKEKGEPSDEAMGLVDDFEGFMREFHGEALDRKTQGYRNAWGREFDKALKRRKKDGGRVWSLESLGDLIRALRENDFHGRQCQSPAYLFKSRENGTSADRILEEHKKKKGINVVPLHSGDKLTLSPNLEQVLADCNVTKVKVGS